MGEISFPPDIRRWIAARLSEGYVDETDYLIELIRRDMAEAAWPETPEEVVERIVAFRANVLLNVGPLAAVGTPPVIRSGDNTSPQLRLVTDTPTDTSEPVPSTGAPSADAHTGRDI